MLAVQVQYWNMVENARHNRVQEAIDQEKNRLGWANLDYSYASLDETKRHNVATEELQSRSLDIQAFDATTRRQQVAENVRHNLVSEAQGQQIITETHRHNVAQEGIGYSQVAVGWANVEVANRQARVAEVNANTQRLNAQTQARNAEINAFNADTSRMNYYETQKVNNMKETSLKLDILKFDWDREMGIANIISRATSAAQGGLTYEKTTGTEKATELFKTLE